MMSNTKHSSISGIFILIALMLIITSIIPTILASGELPTDQYHIVSVDETLRAGRRDGFEPHIIAGPAPGGDGEWYYYDSPSGMLSPGVSNTRRPGNVWVSKDYGFTWEFKEKDMHDLPPQDPGASGDTFIAITKDGGLFHTDLYLSTASVDYSGDGGENWALNPLASNYVFDDRQWLDIGISKDGLGDETLYFSFNQLFPLGLVMVKTPIYTNGPLDNYLWTPCNNGLPITTDVSARDPFCVDEESGTIYITNYASGAGNLEVWKSTNGGDSFTQHIVDSFSGRPAVQNIFTVIDTDMDGNIYITYSSRDAMWLAVSTDEAATWTTHMVTDNATTSVKVLPWVAGGDGGRVAMAWYESEEGFSGSPDDQHDSWWDVKAAISHNGDDENPMFEIITVHEDVHYGGIQTTGTGGGSDRDLGDYLTCDIDNNGRLLVSYGFDQDDGPNARLSIPMYAGQMDGPFLRDDTGPQAEVEVKVDGAEVRVNIVDAVDLSDFEITNISVDFGDGSEYVKLDNVTSISHEYSDSGDYIIQVQVTNEIGMRVTQEFMVSVDDDEGWTIAGVSGWAVVGGPLFILIILFIVLFLRNQKEENSDDRGYMMPPPPPEESMAEVPTAQSADDEISDDEGGRGTRKTIRI